MDKKSRLKRWIAVDAFLEVAAQKGIEGSKSIREESCDLGKKWADGCRRERMEITRLARQSFVTSALLEALGFRNLRPCRIVYGYC